MTGVALVAAWILLALLVLGAILLFMFWTDKRRNVSLAGEKLTAFRTALQRLGADIDDATLLQIYSGELRKFDNPYVAALNHWVTLIRRMSRLEGWQAYYGPGGGKSPPWNESRPEPDPVEVDRAFGLATVCEFVLEGRVSREEGRRYFDKIVEVLREVPAKEGRAIGGVASFDSLLEKQRAKVPATN